MFVRHTNESQLHQGLWHLCGIFCSYGICGQDFCLSNAGSHVCKCIVRGQSKWATDTVLNYLLYWLYKSFSNYTDRHSCTNKWTGLTWLQEINDSSTWSCARYVTVIVKRQSTSDHLPSVTRWWPRLIPLPCCVYSKWVSSISLRCCIDVLLLVIKNCM